MKTKELIIIVGIIVIACIGVGAYFMFSSTPEYKNITMNEITFGVPASNVNVTNMTEHYSIYNDSQKGVAIFVFDSENSTLSDMGDAASFAAIRDTFQFGAQLQQDSNLSFNHSDTLNVYTYLTNYGHKNVFIVTKDKKDMINILSSIDISSISIDIDSDNDTTENTTTTSSSEKSSKSSESSSVREEDKVTSEGWNPKEHEVSRKSLGDGMERVEYDDGYHRVVDSDGNVLSYGF